MSLHKPFDCICQCNSISIEVTLEITLSLKYEHTSARILSLCINDNVDKINMQQNHVLAGAIVNHVDQLIYTLQLVSVTINYKNKNIDFVLI